MHPRLVTPGYLETMGIPVREGRVFSASDAANERHVAVVSEITANRYWPNESALGKRFRFTVEGAPWLEVVGVVGSVHNRAPDREPTPDVYLPFREHQFRYVPTRVALVIKSSLDASSLGPGIRQAIASIEPSVSVADIRALDSFVDDVTMARRFILLLVSLFATAAMVLAAAGLYGLLSFVVGQRTGEIGVRMALGASRLQILREVLAQGVRLAGAGILIGLFASLALARLMSTLLFGVTSERSVCARRNHVHPAGCGGSRNIRSRMACFESRAIDCASDGLKRLTTFFERLPAFERSPASNGVVFGNAGKGCLGHA